MLGRAGDDLDRRTRPRAPARSGARTRSARPRSRPRAARRSPCRARRRTNGAEDRVEEAAAVALVEAGLGVAEQVREPQVLDAAERACRGRSRRRSGRAGSRPPRPGASADPVAEAPGLVAADAAGAVAAGASGRACSCLSGREGVFAHRAAAPPSRRRRGTRWRPAGPRRRRRSSGRRARPRARRRSRRSPRPGPGRLEEEGDAVERVGREADRAGDHREHDRLAQRPRRRQHRGGDDRRAGGAQPRSSAARASG